MLDKYSLKMCFDFAWERWVHSIHGFWARAVPYDKRPHRCGLVGGN